MSRGVTIWFTGLSGAGKTTLADLLAPELEAHGHHVEKLDGDVVRTHLSKGLGFSKDDRDTNIRRIGWVTALGTRLGGTMLVSAISPYRKVRREVRAMTDAFFENKFITLFSLLFGAGFCLQWIRAEDRRSLEVGSRKVE